MHPGHLFALDWASRHCDHLTAAINIDPTCDNPKKEKPLEPDIDRFVRLLSCKFVDNVTYYEGEKELEALYRFGDYDIAFISVEHEESYTPTYKAKPIFVPKLSEHSSTRLRKKIRETALGHKGDVEDTPEVAEIPYDSNGSQVSTLSADRGGDAPNFLIEGFRLLKADGYSVEFYAERQHQIWAHWMDYQFGLCEEREDGSLVIPADRVARWKRQLATAYDELSEAERESDRQVVRDFLGEVL